MMTRKHFDAIARALNTSKARLSVCIEVAAELQQFNDAFDPRKFLQACSHNRRTVLSSEERS